MYIKGRKLKKVFTCVLFEGQTIEEGTRKITSLWFGELLTERIGQMGKLGLWILQNSVESSREDVRGIC